MHQANRGLWLAFLMLFSHYGLAQYASEICNGTPIKPCIIQDSVNQYAYPQLLRHSALIAKEYKGNILGVNELYTSASEEPSEKGWDYVFDYINKNKIEPKQPIVVIDLRQESHGYLNGRAITLVASHNWLNLGKSNEQSKSDENTWLYQLSSKGKVYGILTNKQYASKDYSNGKVMAVTMIRNEEYFVLKHGINYKRLYVADHMRPLDSEVDEFLKIIRSNPQNTWYHIHCRAGKGRTTTFLSMYDMLKNADKVSFDSIIERQATIFPFYDLAAINHGTPEMNVYYVQRYEFLKEFYLFSRDALAGYHGTWSKWRSERI